MSEQIITGEMLQVQDQSLHQLPLILEWQQSPLQIMRESRTNQVFLNLRRATAYFPLKADEVDFVKTDTIKIKEPQEAEPTMEAEYIALRDKVLKALDESNPDNNDIFSLIAMGRSGAAKGQTLMGFYWLFNNDLVVRETVEQNLLQGKKELRIIAFGPLSLYAEVLKEEGKIPRDQDVGKYPVETYAQLSLRGWEDIDHDIIPDNRYVTVIMLAMPGPTMTPQGVGTDRFNSIGYKLLTDPRTKENAKLYMIQQDKRQKRTVTARRKKIRLLDVHEASQLFNKSTGTDYVTTSPTGKYRRLKTLTEAEQRDALKVLKKCSATDFAIKRANKDFDELKRNAAIRLGYNPNLRRLTDVEAMVDLAFRGLHLSSDRFEVIENPWMHGRNTYDLTYYSRAVNYVVDRYYDQLSFLHDST